MEGPELFALYQSVYDKVAPFVAEIEGKLHLDNSNINSVYRKGWLGDGNMEVRVC